MLGRGSGTSQKQIFVRASRSFDTNQVLKPEGILCVFQRDQKEDLGQKSRCSAGKMFSEVTKEKSHPLNKIRGGIQKYSTVPPWLRQMPSLIDALTGAPGGPFPTFGSEVVSVFAVLRLPCTKVAPSLGILRKLHVFITAFDS